MKKYKKLKIYKYLDNPHMVEKIIEAGGDLNRIYRKTKEHALFFAVEDGVSKDVLKMLLDADIDLNIQNKQGDSIVHVCKDLDKLELIISYGADVNLFNKASVTPIFGCIDHDRAKLLVDSGADLNVCDADGNHFLKSIHASDFDLMKIFIDKGLSRFLEKTGLTLDSFLETWSTREVVAYFENKLVTSPELYKLQRD
ncbi:hypothetical protein EZV73_06115 [Acidaminobacter sp. JC074]|uniref:ankyrin repeat domain-containing protein n=1 Tax=Acidaminobacter sp. JC074 TaxID=2530199 RepID=UPI001F0F7973|nr:ankyrin repeat domain-containing protein [Acidaminobacter sp. JC074]MCH4887135.1 hypothetical protein [Acidaminobacter sp. JC074]